MTTQEQRRQGGTERRRMGNQPGSGREFPGHRARTYQRAGFAAAVQAARPVADERALPPMPKPAVLWHSDFTNQTYYGYTADHMRLRPHRPPGKRPL